MRDNNVIKVINKIQKSCINFLLHKTSLSFLETDYYYFTDEFTRASNCYKPALKTIAHLLEEFNKDVDVYFDYEPEIFLNSQKDALLIESLTDIIKKYLPQLNVDYFPSSKKTLTIDHYLFEAVEQLCHQYLEQNIDLPKLIVSLQTQYNYWKDDASENSLLVLEHIIQRLELAPLLYEGDNIKPDVKKQLNKMLNYIHSMM
jgi:hypothetical protein